MSHNQNLIPQQGKWIADIRKTVIFILLSLTLLTACDAPDINNNGNNNGVGNGNQGNCNGVNNCNTNNTVNSGSGTQNSSSGITPIPTVVPTPTSPPPPLPYSVSKTGDVCKPLYNQFQASGWVAEKNSFVFTGTGSNVVISPCNITTPNYAVTATITLFKGRLGVGIVAHADSNGQNGYAGGSGCRNISFGKCGFFINDHFGDIMGIDEENENLTGQTHTYKLVVDGVTLQLFYDNSTIPNDQQQFATFPQAGYAGFECYDQCEVTEFSVAGI